MIPAPHNRWWVFFLGEWHICHAYMYWNRGKFLEEIAGAGVRAIMCNQKNVAVRANQDTHAPVNTKDICAKCREVALRAIVEDE